MKTLDQITHIAESLGWNIDVDENDITFSKYTSAGQDFISEAGYEFTAPKGSNISIIDTEICGLND